MTVHNMTTPRAQQEWQYPLHVVVRADGKFPYQPKIVCPLPERKYEAQIGLREMEEQAARTAPVEHILAKWSLETLASKAAAHIAHLRNPVAVMNCTLCRTSIAGTALLDCVTSPNPAAPIRSPRPTLVPTPQASGCLRGSPFGNTTEIISDSDASTWSDVRFQMVYHGRESWASTTRQPLLPDRDAIATNSWIEAYSLSLAPPLEGEEEEKILWPRGVGSYALGGIRNVVEGCVAL